MIRPGCGAVIKGSFEATLLLRCSKQHPVDEACSGDEGKGEVISLLQQLPLYNERMGGIGIRKDAGKFVINPCAEVDLQHDEAVAVTYRRQGIEGNTHFTHGHCMELRHIIQGLMELKIFKFIRGAR